MTTKTYHVPNISCGHCVSTIERELRELVGVKSVKAEEELQERDRRYHRRKDLDER